MSIYYRHNGHRVCAICGAWDRHDHTDSEYANEHEWAERPDCDCGHPWAIHSQFRPHYCLDLCGKCAGYPRAFHLKECQRCHASCLTDDIAEDSELCWSCREELSAEKGDYEKV